MEKFRMNIKSSWRPVLIAALLLAAAGTAFAADTTPSDSVKTIVNPDFKLSPETFFKTNTNFQKERKVFAWFMMCCGPFNGGQSAGIDQYMVEIQMAQSMGIDGFGLDIMQVNKEYKTSIEKIFQAAKQLNSGFKLFFEFDYGKPDLVERSENIIALLKEYSKHECYQLIDGRPLAGYYGGDLSVKENQVKSIEWWRENVVKPLAASNINIFYVPTTWEQIRSWGGSMDTSNAEIASWGETAQGMSIWQIQLSPLGGGLKLLERHAEALHNAGKTWMSTVAMHYWCGSSRSIPSWYWKPGQPAAADCVNGTYYEHAGGKGLDMQWQSVINIQKPEWVMLLTWNDYNESYITPVDDYRKYPNGTGQAPLGWYKSMAGLDELNRYYIQWYKTGSRPEITADSLFYSYRTSSQKLIASHDPRPPVKIGNGPVGDDIYITTALTAPARLLVISGSSKNEFDVPAGINHTVVPFSVGKQSFSLWRDGARIANVDGAPVVDSIQFYNYWPTTGHVKAGNNGTQK
jgi:glucan endo-1,3-alpha-glucosidase